MEQNVLQELHHIADRYFLDTELNGLIKAFIAEKAIEGSKWSDITRNIHYMLGGASPLIDRFAAITELILLSFDIIDDLQDQDNRSKPWMTCPPEYALNAVLAFLISFIGELGEVNVSHPKAMSSFISELSQLLASSIKGQQMDLNRSVLTEADYIFMVQQKSGSLMRFACFMGYALIEGLDKKTMDQIDEMAIHLGVIAQIGNDLKDVIRYDLKNDLLQKKRTLPIIYLLVDSPKELPVLTQFYEGEISDQAFLLCKQECIQYIHDSGCIEYSKIIQSLFVDRAEEIYASLPALSPWKEAFRAFLI